MTSNSRIVVLSIAPIRCSPSAVLWTVSAIRLRYFFAITRHLSQLAFPAPGLQRRDRGTEIDRRELFERGQLVGPDVVALILGEPVEEHGPVQPPIGDHCAVPARASLPHPGDALLDQAAAKAGIN